MQVRYDLARVTLMAQEPPDGRAILLLYPSLVILMERLGTGELDAMIDAVLSEGVVDEHTVVVGVDAEHGKGQLFGNGFQPHHRQGLLPDQQGHRPDHPWSGQPAPTSVATRL